MDSWSKFWDVFPVIIIFPTFAIIIKWYLEYRTRRMLIEKGLVDEKVKYLNFGEPQVLAPSSLKWGLVLAFVGIIIVLLRALDPSIDAEYVLGGVLVAAGAGMLVYYAVCDMAARKRSKLQRN